MNYVFLETTSMISTYLPLIAIVAVMYFFFIRPQARRQKEETKFRSSLEKGMKVVTTSGIHGKILEVDDKSVLLECENARLRFVRTAISKEMSATVFPTQALSKSK